MVGYPRPEPIPLVQDAPPPDHQFDAAVAALGRAGQRRLLIATVETWDEVGQPSARARQQQVEALLDLGMTDRAWTRLERLRQHPDAQGDPACLTLAARLYLAHGWPEQARHTLDTLRESHPDHPDLASLDRQLAHPPEPVPADLPIEQTSRKVALQWVRRALATGALFQAGHLIDRCLARWPEDPSFSDLRWALSGRYALDEPSLRQVVERWGGGATAPPEITPLERQTPPPAPFVEDLEDEPTEQMHMSDLFGDDGPPTVPNEVIQEDTQLLRVVDVPAMEPEPPPPASPLSGGVPELEPEDDGLVVLRPRSGQRSPRRMSLPSKAPVERERLPLPRGTPPPSASPTPARADPPPGSVAPSPQTPPDPRLLALVGGALLAMTLGLGLVWLAM